MSLLIEGALEEAPVTSISAGEAHSFLTSDGGVRTAARASTVNGNGGSSDVLTRTGHGA